MYTKRETFLTSSIHRHEFDSFKGLRPHCVYLYPLSDAVKIGCLFNILVSPPKTVKSKNTIGHSVPCTNWVTVYGAYL